MSFSAICLFWTIGLKSIKELVLWGTTELEAAGVADPCHDARLLLEYCLGKNRTELFLGADCKVQSDKLIHYQQFINCRKKRKPIAYIVGQCEFWSLPFYITPDVLIPRPETEFLLDRVLSLTERANLRSGKILDLCSGSGVIAVVFAKETGKRIIALDISHGALWVAKNNAWLNKVASLVDLIQADLFSGLLLKQHFSLIVSNPPYVSHFDVKNSLQPDVAGFEPHLALDGGEEGLEVIYKIRNMAPLMLRPGGEIFLEIGADQGKAVEELFLYEKSNLPHFDLVEILVDYAGRDRVLHAVLSK